MFWFLDGTNQTVPTTTTTHSVNLSKEVDNKKINDFNTTTKAAVNISSSTVFQSLTKPNMTKDFLANNNETNATVTETTTTTLTTENENIKLDYSPVDDFYDRSLAIFNRQKKSDPNRIEKRRHETYDDESHDDKPDKGR